ncbi:MAG: universal stress protein [Devosia sp.]
MDIRAILVNVDLDTANSTALKYAIDLAKTFDAELIGVAAEEPNLAFVGVEGSGAAVDFYALERSEIEKRLDASQQHFRALLPTGMKSQWHAYLSSPVGCLLDTAHMADLIVTGATTSSTFGGRMRVNLGELVLASGRPVLDVGKDVAQASLDKIVIGWKDTREARRAVTDALPFLKRAKQVSALTISEGDVEYERRNLDGLIAWLGKHGVTADSNVIVNSDGYVDVLESTALADGANLIVAGGYGHSRMREWLFGGMTRSLLESSSLNRLLSN